MFADVASSCEGMPTDR